MNVILNQAFEIMWKGMAGIFAVIIIIMIAVFIMSKIGKDKSKNKEEES